MAKSQQKASMVRPEVALFAEMMEAKLAENDYKGHWSEAPWDYHVERLQQEVEELYDALMQGNPRCIAEEAVDVANFAMFITDICYGLENGSAPPVDEPYFHDDSVVRE